MNRFRLPRGYKLWAGLCVLLMLGMLTTVMDVLKLPTVELLAANANGQRVIIDPASGVVSGVLGTQKDAPFEVATGEETATEPLKPPPVEPMEISAEPASPTSKLSDDLVTLRTQPNQVKRPELSPSRESIVPPQAPEITEKLEGFAVPKRGDKNITPASLYAKGFARVADKAMVSLVITEAGFSPATLAQIATLPHEVTVGVSPYAVDSVAQIALLHIGGFETWGMLPAQGARYPQDDPGPLGMIAGLEAGEQMTRLHKAMAATIGAVGLILPPDETLSSQPDFATILTEIDGRGLDLLATHPNRTVEQMSGDAERRKIIRRADLVLDSTASAALIQSKLAGIKALAQKQGKLIVVAAARPQTLALVSDWLKTHPLGDEVVLAPLSALYQADAPPVIASDTTESAPGKSEGGH